MRIFITGVSAGFGQAMARLFARDGHFVIGSARRADRLARLQDELGDRFLGVCFDVSDRRAREKAIADLGEETLSGVDVLINNAGLALGLDRADKADMDDWEAMIRTNAEGLVGMTRLILPYMIAKNSGHIVNIGSVAGSYPYFGANVYGATKAFVAQFSLNLRADLAGTNIRVSNIEPGLCGDTEFSHVRFKGDAKKAAQVYENTRFVSPEQIADVARYVIGLPPTVNVNRIEIMPTAQTFAGLTVFRDN